MINKIKKYSRYILVFTFILLVMVLFYFSRFTPIPPRSTEIVIPSVTPTIDPRTAPASDSYDYNQAFDKLLKTYPWYTSLPIETTTYRIIFDYEKQQFRIRIFDSNITTKNKQVLISDALNKLKKIGVDLNGYKYYVILGTSSPSVTPAL